METEVKEKATKIYKSLRDGWNAKTLTTTNGITWEIYTGKRYSGVLSTTAQECKALNSEHAEIITFSPFTDHSVNLIAERVTCTEKAVRDQHYKALAIFEQKREAGELPKVEPEEVLKVGQIVWLNGYGQDKHHHERKAVYEINGRTVKTVNLDTFVLSQDDYVKHDSKLFGIGTYWTTGDMADPVEIGEAIIKAKEKAIEKAKQQQAKKTWSEAKKTAEIEEGKKIIESIPAWATHIIIGVLEVDDSDPMTDYFGSHTEQTIYLAFSSHGRDLFPELRKAAANSEFTKKFTEVPTVNRNGEVRTEENKNWWTPEDEHREKYSMGSGYYLGAKYSRSGWQVKKTTLGGNYGVTLESLQIAAAQGRYFIPSMETSERVEPAEGTTVRRNEEKNGIEIIFPGRPSDQVLETLKANGWKWSRFNKVWYNMFSDDNLTFANGLI